MFRRAPLRGSSCIFRRFSDFVSPNASPLNGNGSRTTRLVQRAWVASSAQENIMNVFDRNTKRKQRNRTAMLEDFSVYEYLKEEIGYRMADRICDVKRKFDIAVDLGCGRGHVAQHIYKDMIGTLIQTDMAEDVLKESKGSPEVPTYRLHVDEEFLPFPENSIDLFISSLSLHWVNDLPATFRQIHYALKGDGCFLGSLFGGDTLFELRVALQQAELEREGGFAVHISPFTSAQDLGGLLNRAGYVMLTIDVDDLIIYYPSMFELMEDLKGMGENNCAWARRGLISRDTLMAASAIYKEMYSKPDREGVPATYQIINFIAWKADPSQKPPAKRGSGQISLKDIHKLDEIIKEMEETKDAHITDHDGQPLANWDKSFAKLSEDIEKLRRSTVEYSDTKQDDDNDDNKKKS